MESNKCATHNQLEADYYCYTHNFWLCEKCVKEHPPQCEVNHFEDMYEEIFRQMGIIRSQQYLKVLSVFKQRLQIYKQEILVKLDNLDFIISQVEEYENYKKENNQDLILSQVKQMIERDVYYKEGNYIKNQIDDLKTIIERIGIESYKLPFHQPEPMNSQLINIEEQGKIESWIGYMARFNLLFRASEQKYSASEFHKCCANKGPTLVICVTEFNKIIGGYTEAEWKNTKGHKEIIPDPSGNTFIFSINKNKKLKLKNLQQAICSNQDFGPHFGNAEIQIVDKCHYNKSVCYFGHNNYYETGGLTRLQFSGSKDEDIMITDYEVYQVQKIN